MAKKMSSTPRRKPKPTLPLESVAKEEAKKARPLNDAAIEERMERINEEFRKGFELLKTHPDTVTFFGSSRFTEDNPYYQQARMLASRIVKELGLTIVSGGGPGIMEAGSRGAHDAKGKSVGYTIELPTEQVNQYFTHSVDFYYFFSRKLALTFTARAYVYFPGGFGTMDEFFELLTLEKTNKIPKLPIILIGSDFWQPLLDFIQTSLRDTYKTISPEDMLLYTLTDDFDEVLKIIAGSTSRQDAL